jgi:hypothetical protein
MIEESRVNKTTATTMPTSHPIRNPTLVPFARGDSSIKIAAMIGIGLMAMQNLANHFVHEITPAHGSPLFRHRSSASGRPDVLAYPHSRNPSRPQLPRDGDPDSSVEMRCHAEVTSASR